MSRPLVRSLLHDPLAFLPIATSWAPPAILSAILAGWPGRAGVVAGVLLGNLAARQPGVTRLRPVVASCGLVLGAMAGLLVTSIVLGQPLVVRLLGLSTAFSLEEATTWGLVTVGWVGVLRIFARVYRELILVEAGTLVATATWAVFGHRDLHLDQPMPLSDWAWIQGVDPLVLFFGWGAVTLGVAMLALLWERSKRRHWVGMLLLWVLSVLSAGGLFLWSPTASFRSGARSDSTGSSNKPNQELDFTPPQRDQPVKPSAVVLLHDDYSPMDRAFYFRQMAYSQYNGGRLIRSTGTDCDHDVPGAFPVKVTEIPGRDNTAGRVIRTTVCLITEHTHPLALTSPVRMEPCANPDPRTFRQAYRAQSLVPVPASDGIGLSGFYVSLARRGAGNPRWTAAQWQHYLAGPADPRYRALADTVLTEWWQRARLKPQFRRSPILAAIVLKEWLGKNGIYSLRAKHRDPRDPTGSFLFGDRRGYCVHFAHALALLLRTQGVPARVGGGYCVPLDRRGKGSSILLTNHDQHAWCEVYIEGAGWIAMEVYPEKVETPPTRPNDPELERRIGELARGQTASEPEGEGTFPIQNGTGGLAVLGLILILCLYVVKIWRLLAWRWASGPAAGRLCYRAMLDRLAGVGQLRQYGEPREDFARRLAAPHPEFAQATAAHLASVLTGTERLEATAWRALVVQLNERIRAIVPLWRRLIAFVDPAPWLRAR